MWMIRSIRSGLGLPWSVSVRTARPRRHSMIPTGRPGGPRVWRERGAPMTPRPPPRMLAGHCDRYVVTSGQPSTCRGRIRAYRCRSAAVHVHFRNPLYPAPHYEPVRPANRDSTSAPGSRGPGSLARPRFPDRRCGRPPQRTPPTNAPRRSNVTYVDRTLNCVDCGVEFIHSAADQEYYVAEGVRQRPEALHELPRQPACRSRRRLRRPRHRWPARLRARRRPPERASTSRSSARPAATRPRSRSSRAWTGRSTARTASGPSAPTEHPSVRRHGPDPSDSGREDAQNIPGGRPRRLRRG